MSIPYYIMKRYINVPSYHIHSVSPTTLARRFYDQAPRHQALGVPALLRPRRSADPGGYTGTGGCLGGKPWSWGYHLKTIGKDPKCWFRRVSSWLMMVFIVINNEINGFHGHGGSPIAGWFMSGEVV